MGGGACGKGGRKGREVDKHIFSVNGQHSILGSSLGTA